MTNSCYEDFALFKRKKINISDKKIRKLFSDFSYIYEHSPELSIDNHWDNLFIDLAKYFICHNSFSGNLSKGIYLWGDIGRGKTTVMQFFSWFLYSNWGNRYPISIFR